MTPDYKLDAVRFANNLLYLGRTLRSQHLADIPSPTWSRLCKDLADAKTFVNAVRREEQEDLAARETRSPHDPAARTSLLQAIEGAHGR